MLVPTLQTAICFGRSTWQGAQTMHVKFHARTILKVLIQASMDPILFFFPQLPPSQIAEEIILALLCQSGAYIIRGYLSALIAVSYCLLSRTAWAGSSDNFFVPNE